MADTVYTPDGRAHVLLGSTTPASIIRGYAGEDVLRELQNRFDELLDELGTWADYSSLPFTEWYKGRKIVAEMKAIFK